MVILTIARCRGGFGEQALFDPIIDYSQFVKILEFSTERKNL
jgi:hypothetical protein